MASFDNPEVAAAAPANASPAVTFEEAVSNVTTQFKSVDTDANGFLSPLELTNASQSDQYNAAEKASISALFGTADGLQGLSNDEWMRERSGISLKDLQAAQSLVTGSELRTDIEDRLPGRDLHSKRIFGAVLNDAFERIDLDKDNMLNQFELKAFSEDEKNSADERQVAGELAKHVEDFRSLTNTEPVPERDRMDFGVQGPFYDDWNGEGPPNISREDVKTFNDVMATEAGLESTISDMRWREITKGVGFGTTFAALSSINATFTYFSAVDMPVLAAGTAFLTVSSAWMSYESFKTAVIGDTDLVREQHKARKEMLDSWKYFSD
jgi:hypothetical protein